MKTSAVLRAAAGRGGSYPAHAAIVFTSKSTSESGGTDHVDSASMTPTAGSLLVMMIADSGQVEVPVFSGTIGGTWTLAGAVAAGSGFEMRIYSCSDYASSGVLTATFATNTNSQMQVFQAVNANLVTPFRQYKTAVGTTSLTPSVALDLAPRSVGQCVGFFAGQNGFIYTAGAAFTRLAHNENRFATAVEFDTGGDGEQTIDASTTNSNAKFCVAGVEFA